MAVFPKIQSPCPYRSQLAAIMQGDMCRMCKRQVVDLSPMSDGERRDFLDGCAEEVCVSYKAPAAAVAAVLALAAAAAPLPAAAQDVTEVDVDYIIVGGIKDKSKVELVQLEDPADLLVPELPVIEEEPAKADQAASPEAPVEPAAPDELKARPAP